MVDWQNPVTIFNEYGAFIKLVHVIDGIYLWEFICNIGFEMSLLRGRRQWRWTAALYIALRFCTISQVIVDIVGLNLTNQFNCKTWLTFDLFFRYITTTLALCLYGLRCVAVWQRSRIVMAINVALVLANLGAWIRRVYKADGVWVPQVQTCIRLHSHVALLNNALLLGSEVVFLMLIACGIYMQNVGARAFKIMYREGLLWLVLAILLQTVPVVFLILNLNSSMNVMFIHPAVVFTSIGATRMYRNISDRHAGNLLDFWETSRDEVTGEIRFRRQTQLVGRTDAQNGDTASSTALPMARLVRAPPQPEERYVERFEARDIEFSDDNESAKRSIGTVDDKQEVEWVHAK